MLFPFSKARHKSILSTLQFVFRATETSNMVPLPYSDLIVKLPFTSRARSRILISPNAFLPLGSLGSNPWPLSSIRSVHFASLLESIR